MVQTTFTRQKRELAKAVALIEKIRAQEVRVVTYSPERQKLEETRDSWVDVSPEEIATRVLAIVRNVVSQHGARQKANSQNTGRFSWCGIEADLTVPQLRALQDAYSVIAELANRLPRRNPKLIENTTVDGRPAFAHREKEIKRRETRYVPFEEDSSTRVRTYAEEFEVVEAIQQTIEVDFGIDVAALENLKEAVGDLRTSIQCAIDDANAKGQEADQLLESVIDRVCSELASKLPSGQ